MAQRPHTWYLGDTTVKEAQIVPVLELNPVALQQQQQQQQQQHQQQQHQQQQQQQQMAAYKQMQQQQQQQQQHLVAQRILAAETRYFKQYFTSNVDKESFFAVLRHPDKPALSMKIISIPLLLQMQNPLQICIMVK